MSLSNDWKTTLAVFVKDENGMYMVTPILSVAPTIATPAAPIDSVNMTNMGYVHGPTRFSFRMAVQALQLKDSSGVPLSALGDSNITNVAYLMKMQLNRTEFSLVLVEQGDDVSQMDWVFSQVIFNRCIIISSDAPTVPPPGVVPTITFNCLALELQAAATDPAVELTIETKFPLDELL
ncbi:MAG: hypothetical protein ACTSRA_00370 [Promethearchaeota archaeon]|nr:MAG: hypothetical protein [Helarchaeota virus Nidhogg Meg22_1012]URC17409.1 MAG: hypothetical protein [Helarchaeota virus Nidhogg Meg22_1214]